MACLDSALGLKRLEVDEFLKTCDRYATYEGLDEGLAFINVVLSDGDEHADNESAMLWRLHKAAALRLRHLCDVRDPDLEEARTISESVLNASKSGTEPYILALYTLGRIHEQNIDFDDRVFSRRQATEFYRLANADIDRHPSICQCMRLEVVVHLGRSLAITSVRDGTMESQLESIRILQWAIRQLSDHDPLKAFAYHALGEAQSRLSLYRPEDESSEAEALAEADASFKTALILAGAHPLRYRVLDAQLHQKLQWFIVTSELRYLEEGIAVGEQLLASIPSTYLANLGGYPLRITADIYFRKYELQGILKDLNASIHYQREALKTNQVTPYAYANLCEALGLRFVETNVVLDIDDAIRFGETSVKICRDRGDFALYPHLYLGLAYTRRFLSDEDPKDQRAAEANLNEAVNLATAHHPRFPDALAHSLEVLVTLSCACHGTLIESMDVERAIANMRQAVQSTRNPFYVPRRRSRLGECLLLRFQQSGDRRDLEEAIAEINAAIESSATGPERHVLLYRRSWALRLRFVLSHDEPDFEQALRDITETLQLSEQINHPKKGFYQSELGLLYATAFQQAGRMEDLDRALSWYTTAGTTWDGFSLTRFRSAIAGAELATKYSLFAKATELYLLAICSLRRIAWLGLNVSARHAILARSASQVPVNGAAAAVRAGLLERAVQILEEGRSLIWQATLDLRADMTQLEMVEPELAKDLMVIGKALEYDDNGLQSASEESAEHMAQRRRRLAERWENLLTRIRSIPGFEPFLEPNPIEDAYIAAKDGPVIILNVSQYGSDALIVRPTMSVCTIPLPGLHYQTVLQSAYQLSQALAPARDGKGMRYLEQVLIQVTSRLWRGGISAAVETACQGFEGKGLPRVWLIPTGLLSLLPIHCAGIYESETRIGIQDFVIPSYTPTLSALRAARRGTGRATSATSDISRRMLAVGLTAVRKFPPLPSAEQEMSILATHQLENRITFRTGKDATVAQVTDDLATHSWFHCCTHGTWQATAPLQSAFQLSDGPLRLSSIMSMHVNGGFAFLSACHTARLSVVLPDESMHLAAGMQMAGFQGVLGTVWGMADRDGPALTEGFYAHLTREGQPLDPRNAAESLHHCIKTFRDRMPLCRWGAFVHFGI